VRTDTHLTDRLLDEDITSRPTFVCERILLPQKPQRLQFACLVAASHSAMVASTRFLLALPSQALELNLSTGPTTTATPKAEKDQKGPDNEPQPATVLELRCEPCDGEAKSEHADNDSERTR
jgi:hypothetical protein